MKIAILGGSFDPIHKGHIGIAKHAIKVLQLDKLFLVPAYKSPFKNVRLADAHHRIAMIKLSLGAKMEVSHFEISRKGTSYTVETLRFFRHKYPRSKVFILIGSDLLSKLNKWREIERIAKLAQIVVFKRSDSWANANLKRYRCQLLDNELYPFSSSAFRSGDFTNLTKAVQQYIGQHHLYVKELLTRMLLPERYKHCLAVARFAVQLAKILNYNAKKAWLAGIFHDVTKNWSIKQHRCFLQAHGIAPTLIPDYKLHAETGALWVDKVYGINDPEVVSAVQKHTALARKLSLLDQIVYVADKLCEGRKYTGIQQDRELVFADFDKGFRNVVAKTAGRLARHHRLDDEQKRIYKEWS